MRSKILNILSIVILSLVIVFETMFLLKVVTGVVPTIPDIEDLVVTPTVVDNLSIYTGPEVIYDSGKGDVIKYYGQRFRIDGTLVSTETVQNGYVNYVSNDSNSHQMTLQISYGVDQLLEALDDYFVGDYAAMMSLLPINVMEENLTFYMQDTANGAVAEIYNNADDKYYMFVPVTDVYIFITSDGIVYITEAAETVVFGDPGEDPMYSHTYNMYEVTAVENTRNALTDGTYDNSEDHMTTEVTGTAATYTSSADNETRKTMLNLGNYTWDKDGTSSDTSMTIDTTSSTAKASEWVLTASSPYSFTDNALKLHTLKAVRTADTFTVSGKVNNTLTTDRPYVLLIKFLNSDRELLGIRVIDKRNEKIPPNDATDWSYVLNADGGIAIADIYALQFEVY